MTTPRFSAWLGTDHAMPWHTNRNGGLVPVPSGKGLDLRASGPVIPLCGQGAIIGHLFERGAVSRRVLRLEPDRIERIVATKGASLVREFWGGYVAFLLDAQGCWHILRDPSGTLPVYWRRLAAGIALASGLEEPPFRYQDGVGIDYEALCLHLGAAHHAGAATCLAGVSELLAGEVLCLGNDGVRNTALWSPWDHVHDRRQDAQVTADDLHAVVSDVVAAWGDVFASVLLGMSGGLDSSIVAAALHRSRTRVRGVTLYWPDGEGDERAWARLAAQSAGVDLQEAAYRFSDVDLDAPVVRDTSRPQLSFHVQALAATDDVLGYPRAISPGTAATTCLV
ncbi:asparagine synthase-related protein [Novosphingobium sp. 9]|uniref:asparagine synthase-related protein n=1 Tax=Novosphingobium sp. 9 TaxID=2025349 RepID=UPI0021B5C771|nr:asparagine synthase-related protein [Novosphingobium sp. 9]